VFLVYLVTSTSIYRNWKKR